MCSSWKFASHTLYHRISAFMCAYAIFFLTQRVSVCLTLWLMKQPCHLKRLHTYRGLKEMGSWGVLGVLYVREMKSCKSLPVIIHIKEQLRLGPVLSMAAVPCLPPLFNIQLNKQQVYMCACMLCATACLCAQRLPWICTLLWIISKPNLYCYQALECTFAPGKFHLNCLARVSVRLHE